MTYKGISIHKFNSRCFLKVGDEIIEVSNYKITSSMRGGTELVITIDIDDSSAEQVFSGKVEK